MSETDQTLEALHAALVEKISNLIENNASEARIEELLYLIKTWDSGSESMYRPKVYPGEPFFLLVARDPLFAPMIDAWAYLRTGHVVMGQRSLEQVHSEARHLEPQRNDDPQILSAFRTAGEGREYQRELILNPPAPVSHAAGAGKTGRD